MYLYFAHQEKKLKIPKETCITTKTHHFLIAVGCGLREARGLRGGLNVELCYWHAPGRHLGGKHGCRVHYGGGANLRADREHRHQQSHFGEMCVYYTLV